MSQLTTSTTQPSRKQVEHQLAASLPRSVVTSLREKVDCDYNVTGYDVVGGANASEIEKAIDILRRFETPMAPREIGQLIARLLALTKQRATDQLTTDLAVEAYGSLLEEYPADIVREVMMKWPEIERRGKWFPSWNELKEEIDWRNTRAMKREALENNVRRER